MADIRKAFIEFNKNNDVTKMSNSEIRRAFQKIMLEDDENELGWLAMKYRGCNHAPDVKEQREKIVKEYAEVVQRLIDSGGWDEVPGLEDMLPHNDMPKIFNEYWNNKWKTKY